MSHPQNFPQTPDTESTGQTQSPPSRPTHSRPIKGSNESKNDVLARAAARAIAQRHTRQRPATPPAILIPRWIDIAARALTPTQRAIYRQLWHDQARYAPKNVRAWWWHRDQQLQRDTGYSQRTISRARAAIAEQKMLSYTPGGACQRPTFYWLTWPPRPPADANQREMHQWALLAAEWGPPTPLTERWLELARTISAEQLQYAQDSLQRRSPHPYLNPWLLHSLRSWYINAPHNPLDNGQQKLHFT